MLSMKLIGWNRIYIEHGKIGQSCQSGPSLRLLTVRTSEDGNSCSVIHGISELDRQNPSFQNRIFENFLVRSEIFKILFVLVCWSWSGVVRDFRNFVSPGPIVDQSVLVRESLLVRLKLTVNIYLRRIFDWENTHVLATNRSNLFQARK